MRAGARRWDAVGWDWTFVGELVVGIAGGMAIGGWLAAQALESSLFKLLSHPTARKLASAAEKYAHGQGGGLLGALGELFTPGK